MPVFDLTCKECGYEIKNEFFKSYKDDNPLCPECKGQTKRLYGTTLIDMSALFRSNPSEKATKESNGARLV